MLLFIIGVVEMLIVTLWTKVVVEARIVASGVVTLVNILIWYYVLETIISDIHNWQLIVSYAFGCALGTMIATAFPSDWFAKKKKTSKKATASLALVHKTEAKELARVTS